MLDTVPRVYVCVCVVCVCVYVNLDSILRDRVLDLTSRINLFPVDLKHVDQWSILQTRISLVLEMNIILSTAFEVNGESLDIMFKFLPTGRAI